MTRGAIYLAVHNVSLQNGTDASHYTWDALRLEYPRYSFYKSFASLTHALHATLLINTNALDWLMTHSAPLDPTVLEHTWLHELTPYRFCFLSIFCPHLLDRCSLSHTSESFGINICPPNQCNNHLLLLLLLLLSYPRPLLPPPHYPASQPRTYNPTRDRTQLLYTHNTIAYTAAADPSLERAYQLLDQDN